MQKRLLIITACMMMILAIAGIVITYQNEVEKQQIEQILREGAGGQDGTHDPQEVSGQNQGELMENGERVFVSLETARAEAVSLIEDGLRGAYRNLQFLEQCPLITEEDRVYQIRVSGPSTAFPITEEKLQNVCDTMQAFFEEPLDEQKITAIPMSSVIDSLSIPELREELRNQKEEYTGIDYVFLYLENQENESDGNRAQIIGTEIYSIMMDTGTPSEDHILPDKVYYPGAADGSLQDIYRTADGEMSVEQAIQQAETYFNQEFPVALTGSMKYRVSRVFLMLMPDGTYGFEVQLRRSYRGVPFQGDIRCREGNGEAVYDLTDTLLNGEHRILNFWGLPCNNQVEETRELSEVISPKKAVEYISQKIGDHTVYTVMEIELSYVGQEVSVGGQWIEEMTPAWLFIMINQTNGMVYHFYVDALTGQVTNIQLD